MRAAQTYRSARRNKPAAKKGRALNKEFRRLSGSNHKLDFPTEKKDEASGLQVPFITYVEPKQRSKKYPYGSTRQGYIAPGPVVTLSW